MAHQPFGFANVTVSAAATAVSVASLIAGASVGAVTPTGACVSLNIVFTSDTYWGNTSTVTNADGVLVAANTPMVDGATGRAGDTVPISQMYVYSVGGASGSVYSRFIP